MSNSINPRITRKANPKRKFTDNTYRKALPFLLEDFERRCAYSQQHTDRSLGEITMEVDHHNPTSSKTRNKYDNLFLATRHCNNAKGWTWPSKLMRKKGIRILNPCAEIDYGQHILEHPVTHRLIGVTAAGDFHITTCDLNAQHLVDERKERAAIYDLLQSTGFNIKKISPTGGTAFPSREIELLVQQAEKMIPPIPYISSDHPKYAEEIAVMRALGRLPI